MKQNKESFLFLLLRAAFCGIVYAAVLLLFKGLAPIQGGAVVRPAAAFPPAFGIAFGFWGAIGCSVSHFVIDLCSGASAFLCIGTFCVQFLYGYVPHLMWKMFVGYRMEKDRRMGRVVYLSKCILILIMDCLMLAVLQEALLQICGKGNFAVPVMLFVFLNSFDFSMLLGLPLLIAISYIRVYRKYGETKGEDARPFYFTLGEKILCHLLLIGILTGAMIGMLMLTMGNHEGFTPVWMWIRIYFIVAAVLMAYFFISMGVMYFVEKDITLPVERLAELSTGYFSHEDRRFLEECRQIGKKNTEVGNLANSYVSMVTEIEHYIANIEKMTAEREKISAELNVAHNIQEHMLPHDFKSFSNRDDFEIYGDMKPAKAVGGDFYDFFMVDEDRLGIVIGDVSDKGVPAALFMVIAKTLIKNFAKANMEPSEVFKLANLQLCENNEEDLFVTAWFGILDLSDGMLRYVNAGHNPPLIKRGDQWEYLKEKSGFVLGGFETTVYKQHQIELGKGEGLLLYTDGITEAADESKNFYGEDRLRTFMNEKRKASAEETVEALKADVYAFVNGAAQWDDLTLLLLDLI